MGFNVKMDSESWWAIGICLVVIVFIRSCGAVMVARERTEQIRLQVEAKVIVQEKLRGNDADK